MLWCTFINNVFWNVFPTWSGVQSQNCLQAFVKFLLSASTLPNVICASVMQAKQMDKRCSYLSWLVYIGIVCAANAYRDNDLTVAVPAGRRECFHQPVKSGQSLEIEHQVCEECNFQANNFKNDFGVMRWWNCTFKSKLFSSRCRCTELAWAWHTTLMNISARLV